MRGQRVLVTAAARGIGLACARACAAAGADVVAVDVDGGALATALEGRAVLAPADCTDAEAVAAIAARHAPFDAVIHAVGMVHHGSVLDCARADWQRSFAVNVDSYFHVLRATLPGMVAARRGSIVGIASVCSSIKGLPNRAAYGATKAAMIGLTKSVAADYVSLGIRCNAICPGTVLSPSLQDRIAELGQDVGGIDQATDLFVSRQPMGRLGTPEEIAALALYLAGDAGAFATGQIFVVDGGMSI